MLNCEEETTFDENDFTSLVTASLRNVIENSIANPVLPYRILSIAHVSSWNTFQNDLMRILKRNSYRNEEHDQDLLLLQQFHYYTTHCGEKQAGYSSVDTLMNFHFDIIQSQSDFDRLHKFM